MDVCCFYLAYSSGSMSFVQALCKLGSLPKQHLQHILHPMATGPSHRSHTLASALVPNSLKASLEQHYNESQQKAICACLSASEPFTLIQVCTRYILMKIVTAVCATVEWQWS